MAESTGPRPLVLAVDDDQGVLDAFHLILDERYEVLEARDGDTALELIRSRDPAVVLLDILLDGMDGISVLQALRTEGRDVPVVIVSGLNRAAPAATAGRLGAVDYVTKPFDEADLLGALDSALRRAGDVAALRPALHAPRMLLVGCPVGLGAALAAMLAPHGRVECVPAGSDAGALAPGIDLVVLDIDGVASADEAYARITSCFPLAPVVILGSPERRRQDLGRIEAEAVTVLLAPLTARALLEAINRELSPAVRPLPAFSRMVMGIIDHVSVHFAGLSPAALGRQLGKTPGYLSRVLRAETGMSLKTYVTRVRVEAARQLLRAGEDKIETVASMVGFHDGSHLSRAFVQHLGRRPSVARRPAP
jgi:DNA-binding response OmpR family regulator